MVSGKFCICNIPRFLEVMLTGLLDLESCEKGRVGKTVGEDLLCAE